MKNWREIIVRSYQNKTLENLSSANQILCLVFCLPIEQPLPQETFNTRICSETSKHLMCFAVIGFG